MDLNVTPIVGGLPTRRTSLDSTPREAPEAATQTAEPARAPGERGVEASKANEGADGHGHDLSRRPPEVPDELDARRRAAEIVDPRNQPTALVQERGADEERGPVEERALDALDPRRRHEIKEEAAKAAEELEAESVDHTQHDHGRPEDAEDLALDATAASADLAEVDAEENLEAVDGRVDEPGKPNPGEEAQIQELRDRDREVRSHEMAHSAAGGRHTGSPNYELERGPDGRMYAVNGDVSVDVAAVEGDARATIAKMRQVHRAALAPAQPSGQDRAVAARAMAQLNQAQEQLATQETEQARGEDEAKEALEVPDARSAVSKQEGNRAYLTASSSGQLATPGEQLDVVVD